MSLFQGFKDCRELFVPAPTHIGICSVFNGLVLDQVMHERFLDTEWTQAFSKYFWVRRAIKV